MTQSKATHLKSKHRIAGVKSKERLFRAPPKNRPMQHADGLEVTVWINIMQILHFK